MKPVLENAVWIEEPARETSAELGQAPFAPSRRAGTQAESVPGGSRPLNVCFVIDRLSQAGIELQLLLLLKWLDRSKIIPHLCLLDGTDEQTRALEPDDCPIIRLGIRRLRHPKSVGAAWRLARFLRRHQIDVVHPLFPDSFYFGTLVAKMSGVPCVAGFCVSLNYWMTPRDRWFGRIVNRLVDGTVANCAACRRAVVADYGAAEESVAIIPNGVDLSRFVDGRHGSAVVEPVAEQRVGIVANLRPVKNIELFIRAAGRLASSHPNARFEIAGDGELRGNLQTLIESLGLCDRVTLLGSVPDIPTFLGQLNVAVLCSLTEGSPNAIMEYMAAGLPTVATDVGGNAEVVEEGVTGLVVPSNDEERLAGAIDRLLRDGELAAQLGATARRRAFAEYGVETQARRYEAFYRELAERKNRARKNRVRKNRRK